MIKNASSLTMKPRAIISLNKIIAIIQKMILARL